LVPVADYIKKRRRESAVGFCSIACEQMKLGEGYFETKCKEADTASVWADFGEKMGEIAREDLRDEVIKLPSQKMPGRIFQKRQFKGSENGLEVGRGKVSACALGIEGVFQSSGIEA